MTGELLSSVAVADACTAALLAPDSQPSDLEGVGDDNTLAESGIYNTYFGARGVYWDVVKAISGEAECIRHAATAFEVVDAQIAQNY